MRLYGNSNLVTVSLGVLASQLLVAQSASAQDSESTEEVEVTQDSEGAIVVTGYRASLNDALGVKRAAPSFVDAISALDIGQFPDQNIAESLQRVPGVTISRDGGEGARITVRGFGPEFNTVRLNNRQLATISGGRAFDFQSIASDMINGAVVSKSPTADLVAGGIGSSVDLRTIRPLDAPESPLILNAMGRYQDIGDSFDPVISAVSTHKFADDTLGVAVSAAWQDTSARRDFVGYLRWLPATFGGQSFRAPFRVNTGVNLEDRERLSLSGTIQWRPSSVIDMTLDGLFVDFDRTFEQVNLAHVPLAGFTPAIVTSIDVNERGTLVGYGKSSQPGDFALANLGDKTRTWALGWNGKAYASDSVTFEADVSYSKASSDRLGEDMITGFADNCPVFPVEVGCVPAPNAFTFELGDVPSITHSLDYADVGNLRAHFNSNDLLTREDEILEGRLDASILVDWGAVRKIQLGGYVQDRTFARSALWNLLNGRRSNSFNPFDPSSDWGMNSGFTNTLGGFLDLPDNLGVVVSFPDLFGSDQTAGTVTQWVRPISFDAVCDYLEGRTGNTASCGLVPQIRQTASVSELTLAGYGRVDFEGEIGQLPFEANIGLRIVNTEMESIGYGTALIDVSALEPAETNSALDILLSEPQFLTEKRSYTELLPSANIKFDITDSMVLRLAAAETITRPAISDLSPVQTYTGNFFGFTVRGGNPDLRPYKSRSFDAGLEWYDQNGGGASVAVFYRDITDFISDVVTVSDSGFDHRVLGDILLNDQRLQNRPGGKIKGVEFSFTHFFKSLPSFLGNMGVQANYTYVSGSDKGQSEIALPDPQNVRPTDQALEGFTPHSYNINLIYEDSKFSSRLAWNWRSDFLAQRIGFNGLPVNVESYGTLDFSASYNLTDRVQLRVEGINMTNENELTYADYRERVLENEYTGRRFMVGARISL